jgi:phage replication-related protein YjqB (UPF0714/DUF867 family)
MRTTRADKYPNFAALERAEPKDAWCIHAQARDSRVLIIAPHGGRIEPGTSLLAMLIAGRRHSLYRFEGLKPRQNRDLHITSHRFDEPAAVALAEKSSTILALHGCKGRNAIFVGGLDAPLRDSLTAALVGAGFHATSHGHDYPAIEPNNICNRGKRKRGAQLEITRDLRSSQHSRRRIATLARKVLAQHLAAEKQASTRKRGSVEGGGT